MEQKSSFQFEGYKVLKSLIEIKDSDPKELKIKFEPKALLNNRDNLFILGMNVFIFDEEKNINVEIFLEGKFSILERTENLKSFLLTNAPAILFPYSRAYITALTALSGIPPITLPTMNLSSLKEKIDKNMEEIN